MTAANTQAAQRDFHVRDRLALALDFHDPEDALDAAARFAAHFGIMKVGLQLFVAGGPPVVRSISSMGCDVFLDLKMHDIPNTVKMAAKQAGMLGAKYLTLHTAGGADMLSAGAEGFSEGARNSPVGAADPVALGVTVLTSESHAPPDLLAKRASLAQRSGCGGLVCAAPDLGTVSAAAPGLIRVVPGIRPAGVSADDQRRVATPASALADGADVLVIGRAVTEARWPTEAADRIMAEAEAALGAT